MFYSLVRIEFNQSQCDHHTALDSIYLFGNTSTIPLIGNVITEILRSIKFTQKKQDDDESNEKCLFLKLPESSKYYLDFIFPNLFTFYYYLAGSYCAYFWIFGFAVIM